jgi:hypothetical protein
MALCIPTTRSLALSLPVVGIGLLGQITSPEVAHRILALVLAGFLYRSTAKARLTKIE